MVIKLACVHLCWSWFTVQGCCSADQDSLTAHKHSANGILGLECFPMQYLWLCCFIKTSTQSLCDGHRVQAASVLLVVDYNCRKQHYTASSLANALCALCIILCLYQSDEGREVLSIGMLGQMQPVHSAAELSSAHLNLVASRHQVTRALQYFTLLGEQAVLLHSNLLTCNKG